MGSRRQILSEDRPRAGPQGSPALQHPDSSDYQTIFEEKDIGLKEFKPTENIWTIGKSLKLFRQNQ